MTTRPAPPVLIWLATVTVCCALLGAAAVTLAYLTLPQAVPVPRPPAPPPTSVRRLPATDPSAYPIKRALKLDRQLKHGDWVWNDAGVPAGEILITIDLKAQLMSVFRDGYEIGVAVIEHGADGKPTPVGVFPILEKDAHHRSTIYVDPSGRPAPMPWAMRLTRDGVFIHGAMVRREWGSNGCVGIPDAFAQRVFGEATPGDVVVITNGAVMKVGDSIHAR